MMIVSVLKFVLLFILILMIVAYCCLLPYPQNTPYLPFPLLINPKNIPHFPQPLIHNFRISMHTLIRRIHGVHPMCDGVVDHEKPMTSFRVMSLRIGGDE